MNKHEIATKVSELAYQATLNLINFSILVYQAGQRCREWLDEYVKNCQQRPVLALAPAPEPKALAPATQTLVTPPLMRHKSGKLGRLVEVCSDTQNYKIKWMDGRFQWLPFNKMEVA